MLYNYLIYLYKKERFKEWVNTHIDLRVRHWYHESLSDAELKVLNPLPPKFDEPLESLAERVRKLDASALRQAGEIRSYVDRVVNSVAAEGPELLSTLLLTPVLPLLILRRCRV